MENQNDIFLREYFEMYQNILLNVDVTDEIKAMRDLIVETNKRGNKIVFAGNGASAAIASHAALDFTKQAKKISICFNETSFITAFANDFGYEKWLQKAIEFHCVEGDVAVLISSSGKSLNIINAAKYVKKNGIKLVTFSGFDSNNPLKQNGDINFWVNSKAYNIIENIHQIWLMAVCDFIIGKAEYSVS